VSISGIIQGVTGQLRQYDPEELDEGLQKALKAIDEDIRKQESELDRLKTDSKVTKSNKEYKRENIKSRINELKEEKQSILFESADQADWEFKTASFDPDNPATSDAMRRRHGVSEGRRMRQQLAKEKAKAKIAAGETSEVKTANIIKADGKWGELSNLSKHSFTWDGKEYNSVEHAYQTNKSGKFDKVTYQAYIDRPEALKIIGKHKADYGTNLELMEDLYRQMLNENPDMLKLLQETEGFEITHQLKKSDIWTKEMPKILTKLRDEFKSTGFETVKMYSVADVQANPDKIYIFGDNTEGWGKGGQAIIRDESNAFGISTKDSPREFMSDDNFEANKAKIDADIAAIKADGRPIVFPEDGIGTGRADLENKAPQTWAYLQEQLEGLKGGTPEVKGGTVYNTIDNPQRQNHYVNRTKYNYANSDITFDFTATGGPSGGGHSAGKGTPDYMKKWTNVAVDNAGKLTASNIDEVAQKLADALTSGQTVNIAGHGNYESTRGGFPKAVWQSQVDTSMQTIFDRAKELAGDKPITGQIISGGQSGFDEAGIRVARNLGIPTEVNVSNYTWRDAKGEHYNDEVGFKERIDADSYDSETFEGKSSYTKAPDLKDLPGTLSFVDNSPPELKADLGLMYKMPPALVDGVAKVGAKVWNQALKVAPLVDEEILIQAPSKLVQQGLKTLGLTAAAGTIGTATVALGTYELWWMLINLGKAALNQGMGEAAEPGGVPPMLFSEHIELGENSEFSNAEQFMKDYEAWAKGSVAIQAFRGVTGHDDPIELMRAGFKKGEQGVNFYGYNMVKGLFGGNK